MNQMKTLLSVNNASFSFGTSPVFENLSLEIKAGEFVVIDGPSGSGKSTLLNCLIGRHFLTSGEIRYLGERKPCRKPKQFERIRREVIGYSAQFGSLVPNLTIAENVTLAETLGAHKGSTAEPTQILQTYGLEKVVSSFPAEISGGERSRASLAVAVTKNAPLLIVDEPTASLDKVVAERILNIIDTYRDQSGRGVLCVTHDENVKKAATRIYTLQKLVKQ